MAKMDKAMPSLAFKMMAAMFAVRDAVAPRDALLEPVGIEKGDVVLDYGCGPGSYVPLLSQMVGPTGRVYAADLHPLAVERVRERARRDGLTNVEVIQTNGDTGLPDGSVDAVLLYDVLHMLEDKGTILAEMRRTLGPEGVLALNEPHQPADQAISDVEASGLFSLARRGERVHLFRPAGSAPHA